MFCMKNVLQDISQCKHNRYQEHSMFNFNVFHMSHFATVHERYGPLFMILNRDVLLYCNHRIYVLKYFF